MTDGEAREIERQVEANDEASRLKRGRQEYLVDKIKDAEWFDASMLRRFGLELLKFNGFNVIIKETTLSQPTLLQELIDAKTQTLGLVWRRLGVEDEQPFRCDWCS